MPYFDGLDTPPTNTTTPNYGWINQANNLLMSQRPDYSSGFYNNFVGTTSSISTLPTAAGWNLPNGGANCFFGMTSQNTTTFSGNGKRWATDPLTSGAGAQYYADADGIVRPGMGSYATPTASNTYGLPHVVATNFNGTATSQVQSRPIILHRPFQSVAELGYVFSGTPWKNLDFFNPQSGDAGLLDVFCINDTSDPQALVAGKVDLNTRQPLVLQAVLAGAYKDEQQTYTAVPGWALPNLTTAEANALASTLVTRTTSTAAGQGPLQDISQLVVSSAPSVPGTLESSYAGDLTVPFVQVSGSLSASIQRFREAPIRALAAAGQTRVWNLLINVVAQTGVYPITASSTDQFEVEGERRYWVHVSIDRLTGAVLDKQIEVIKE